MFLKKLNRRARRNGMTPESALSEMLERKKITCGQVGISLRDYFLKNFVNGVGWMADDLRVAFTTIEEYYAVFSDGERWRIENDGRSRNRKTKRKRK